MKIIINGKFLTQRITGVQRYAKELIFELDKLVSKGTFEIAVPKCKYADMPTYKNIKIVPVGKFKGNAWEQISFPLYVKKKKAISLNLCGIAPLISPDIVCIHDVIPNIAPRFFSKRFVIWYTINYFNTTRRAKKIITVSETSKSYIAKCYKIDPHTISVVPNAWQHFKKIQEAPEAIEKFGLKSREYYFSMSSLTPNKNFKWIAEAAKRNPDMIFAISGGINNNVFAKAECENNIPNLKLLGYINDKEAKTLMKECKAFIFPTFYEGFGIPPLEAISCGAPSVIVSDTDCMHEIYGAYAHYIDPYNYKADLNKIESEYISNIKDVLKKYSWKTSAEKLLYLIENVQD